LIRSAKRQETARHANTFLKLEAKAQFKFDARMKWPVVAIETVRENTAVPVSFCVTMPMGFNLKRLASLC